MSRIILTLQVPTQVKKKRRNKPKKKANKAVEIYKKTKDASDEEYESSEGEDYSDTEDEGTEGYRKGKFKIVIRALCCVSLIPLNLQTSDHLYFTTFYSSF